MGLKITKVAEAIQNNGLKALVHAPAGTGKTVLGATAKAKTLIISAESGLLSLGQNQQELIASGSPDFAPEFCDVVEVTTLAELGEAFDHLVSYEISDGGNYTNMKAKSDYEWVVLDSITEIAEVVLENEKRKSKDPRQAYGELQTKMIKIIKDFRDMPRYNVLMTCKQVLEKDEVTGITRYVPMMPGAKLSQQIPYLFDEVWCLRVGVEEDEAGNKNTFHYIQANRDLQYEAKDRSGRLKADMEPPSLAMLYEKIYGDVSKNEPVVEKKAEVVEGDPVEEYSQAIEPESEAPIETNKVEL